MTSPYARVFRWGFVSQDVDHFTTQPERPDPIKTIVCVRFDVWRGKVGGMRRVEMSEAFAAVLRHHRKAKRLSQEALAEKADLHPTYIGLLERSLRNPSLNVAQALADALGVSLSEIIREAEAVRRSGKR